MPRKTLRLPKGSEWDNLPTTKQQAISLGLNRFKPSDGQLREIRRYGSRSYPNGKIELASSRKSNRGSRTDGTREFNKHFTSPPGTDFRAADQAIASANGSGNDGGHVIALGRQANGQRWKVQQGRGTVEQYQSQFQNAGIAIGHSAGNIAPQSPHLNQQIIPAQERALDKGLQFLASKVSPLDLLRNLAQKSRSPSSLTTQRTSSKSAKAELNAAAQRMRRGAPLLRGANGMADEFGIPQVGTMQGGGFRVEANPFGYGESFMIP